MDEILIESVRQHNVLYDMKCKNYMDQKMRQEAWEEVGRDCEITAEIAKDKWNKLRRCFCNALNRRRIKRCGQANKKIVPWKFEQQMSFLLPFLETRLTQNNIEESESQLSENDEADQTHEEFEDHKIDIHNEFENENSVSKIENVEEKVKINFPENSSGTNEILQSIKKIKRAKSKIAEEMVEIMKEDANLRKFKNECKSVQSKSTWFADLDETDMFFLSMARMTKQLPRYEQTNIKLMLSNAVLQADIQNQERQENFSTELSAYSRPGSSSYAPNNSDNSLLPSNDQMGRKSR